MTRNFRRLNLTAHVGTSVGWLGAVLTYLAIAIAGVRAVEADRVRAAFVSMELIGWTVIVPLALAALLTGLIHSLGTEWGLFRHYWVLTKFILTLVATVVLLLHMPTVSRIAEAAAVGPVDFVKLGAPPLQPVVHSAGGLFVLLAATVLSIYKPWGKTPYGKRAQDVVKPFPWRPVLLVAAVVVALGVLAALHVAGLTPRH